MIGQAGKPITPLNVALDVPMSDLRSRADDPCPACGNKGEETQEYASEWHCDDPECRVQHYFGEQ